MIAPVKSSPLRTVRLNRSRGGNRYELKKLFARLCEERSVTLVTLSQTGAASWTKEKDRRRCALIDKSLQANLMIAEERELSELQGQAEAHFDEVAPPPIDGALRLHAQLLKLADTKKE